MTTTHLPPPGAPAAGSPAQDSSSGGELEATLGALAGMGLRSGPDRDVHRAFEQMVMHAEYPCLGAKSVFRRQGMVHVVLDDMDDPANTDVLLQHLAAFAEDELPADGFHSFIVSFRTPRHDDEAAFERSLFGLLQRLHDADDEPWADGVGSDPADPHFAFSARGTAYFVVGLHPAASRVARRAPLPSLVFNPHDQFERLREEGRYDGMRSRIRARDEMLQGSINPMVADHGDSSEARQYSGRAHDSRWVPPLEVAHGPSHEEHDAR
jgi:FPC/CPF motif-containing protein YcgG